MHQYEIKRNTIEELSHDFYLMGARKITIMGGEPALYGDKNHHELLCIIKFLKELGYDYIRMDSNGIYNDDMLANPGFKLLDEISFSLDGHKESINDHYRGKGAFEKCVSNIKRAIELNYKVCITSCVHDKFFERHDGTYELNNMIKFAQGIGVEEINFHVLLKHGYPMDTWTEDTALTYDQWIQLRDDVKPGLNKFKIRVRLPEHFVHKEDFDKNPEYYGYCPVKMGERVLVHPDGQIRVCSGLISSKYCIARFLEEEKKVIWEPGYTNEILDHDLNNHTPCTNQSKSMITGDHVPLCFSFKPLQKEPVWNKVLEWDRRKTEI